MSYVRLGVEEREEIRSEKHKLILSALYHPKSLERGCALAVKFLIRRSE